MYLHEPYLYVTDQTDNEEEDFLKNPYAYFHKLEFLYAPVTPKCSKPVKT